MVSGRPLVITKRQARVLYDVAEEKRGIAEVNPATGVIRLIPAVLAGDVKPQDPKVDGKPKGYL
jgi:hypothetical protein